jgi:isoquinoline 1-oxidoreductase subunit beta
METKQNVSRRKFLKLTGMSGTVLAIGSYLPAFGKEWRMINAEDAATAGIELNAFISIDTSGKVTIVNHRAEMGQGTFQSIPQIIAEELEVDITSVNIVFAPGNERTYGGQTAGGSSSIRTNYRRLSQLGATAREMLLEAAAQKWNVNKAECYAENGQIIHKTSGKKIGYGELVEEASKLKPATDIKIKRPDQYKIIRKPLPRQDTPIKTNGQAIFGIDKKLPGMLYAIVERSPRFNGKVKSIDDAETKKIPGVKHVLKVNRDVFQHMREGVAIVADSTWAALQGRKVLKVEWDDTGFEHYSTEQLFSKMHDDVKREPNSVRTQGNFKAAFNKAETKVEAIYETPYESHSCMEPLNCIAHVTEDACEIWGPIQGPGWIQSNLSQHLGLPMDKVTVNLTFLGGGFGRKAFTDYPYEAAMLSKEIKAPVQVVWTREDDMTAGPFRPGAVYACKAALSANGRIQAFQTIMAAQNMDLQGPAADRDAYNGDTTEGLLEPYFNSFPHYSFGDVPLDAPIPVMWWRSVYSSTNAFAYESFMDELSVKAGKDPLEFRRQHLRNPRYQNLITKTEEVSGWKNRKKNEGFGVAITECFGSIVAEVVKVSKKADGKIKLDKVWAVMDCGWYVNPDIIAQQVEGSIVMALGAATKHATHFKDGKAVEKNFDTYKMPRINDIPEIEVHVMDNEENAGGVGEPALPPFAPALTNAIYDLTGKRIRTLPFTLDEV